MVFADIVNGELGWADAFFLIAVILAAIGFIVALPLKQVTAAPGAAHVPALCQLAAIAFIAAGFLML